MKIYLISSNSTYSPSSLSKIFCVDAQVHLLVWSKNLLSLPDEGSTDNFEKSKLFSDPNSYLAYDA